MTTVHHWLHPNYAANSKAIRLGLLVYPVRLHVMQRTVLRKRRFQINIRP